MNRIKLIFPVLLVIVLTASSCCQKCTGPFGISVDICRGEYDTQTDYENALAAMELAGYNCQ